MRPHVLWFDECYNEEHYRFESAAAAASAASLLLVVGTTGTTSLPAHILQIARMRDIPVIDINPHDNPFARAAMSGSGTWLRMSATEGMDAILQALS
jgi:NAD-dependent deacetylase